MEGMMKQWILSSNDGMSEEEMRPFRASAARHMPGAEVIEVSGGEPPPVVGRVEKWKEVLDKLPDDGRVMLADGRDQVFQGDVFAELKAGFLHVFSEDSRITIGSCPYNGPWVKRRYGAEVLEKVRDLSILCVGTVVADVPLARDLVSRMCGEFAGHERFPGEEQAVFNVLVYLHLRNEMVWGWGNEGGPVYTVGYLPRESVEVIGGKVVNRAGKVPAAVHQWDRHENLKRWVAEVWG